jgi:hypothetical protein
MAKQARIISGGMLQRREKSLVFVANQSPNQRSFVEEMNKH